MSLRMFKGLAALALALLVLPAPAAAADNTNPDSVFPKDFVTGGVTVEDTAESADAAAPVPPAGPARTSRGTSKRNWRTAKSGRLPASGVNWKSVAPPPAPRPKRIPDLVPEF